MLARIRSCALPTRCLHHDHPYHQLVIGLSGHAEFEVAGYGGRVDAMHGCLVPAGEVHFYEGKGDNRHAVIDFPCLGNPAAAWSREADWRDEPSALAADPVNQSIEQLFDHPRYFTADTNLRLLLSFIDRESHLWPASSAAVEGVAQVLVASLYQRLFDHQPRLPAGQKRLDLVQLEVYIQQHLAEPMTVSQLAQVACVSAGHFHQLFKQATGKTPARYLLEARLERARELLLATRMDLATIAEQVGFSSQSALTHAFRRHWAQTPGQIRRGGLQKIELRN